MRLIGFKSAGGGRVFPVFVEGDDPPRTFVVTDADGNRHERTALNADEAVTGFGKGWRKCEIVEKQVTG